MQMLAGTLLMISLLMLGVGVHASGTTEPTCGRDGGKQCMKHSLIQKSTMGARVYQDENALTEQEQLTELSEDVQQLHKGDKHDSSKKKKSAMDLLKRKKADKEHAKLKHLEGEVELLRKQLAAATAKGKANADTNQPAPEDEGNNNDAETEAELEAEADAEGDNNAGENENVKDTGDVQDPEDFPADLEQAEEGAGEGDVMDPEDFPEETTAAPVTTSEETTEAPTTTSEETTEAPTTTPEQADEGAGEGDVHDPEDFPEETTEAPTTEPDECVAGKWSAWSACTKTCGGGGIQTRKRHVEPAGCRVATAARRCGDTPCPIHCEFSDWSKWGECSDKCRNQGAIMTRTRSVLVHAQHGGKECCGGDTENKTCGAPRVDCALTPWTPWTDCSKSCSTGIQTRKREVETPPSCGGSECICNYLETKNCMNRECVVPCNVSEWSEWSACPATCGGASQKRTREVTTISSGGGDDCPELAETKNCAEDPCKVDCVLSDWEEWSDCSATCYGLATRSRNVLQAPLGNGTECDALMESKTCNLGCQLDCKLGAWGPWGECSVTCGGGSKERSRPVVQQVANGGEACGPIKEVMNCSCAQCEGGEGPVVPPPAKGEVREPCPLEDSKEFAQILAECSDLYPKGLNYDAVCEMIMEMGSVAELLTFCKVQKEQEKAKTPAPTPAPEVPAPEVPAPKGHVEECPDPKEHDCKCRITTELERKQPLYGPGITACYTLGKYCGTKCGDGSIPLTKE